MSNTEFISVDFNTEKKLGVIQEDGRDSGNFEIGGSKTQPYFLDS